MIDLDKWCELIARHAELKDEESAVRDAGLKPMSLGSSKQEPVSCEGQTLEELTKELVLVLEKINSIRPVKFHDYESDYWYNFLGVRDLPDMGYVFIEISGEYDNLPSHEENPLKDGRNRPMLPYPDFP